MKGKYFPFIFLFLLFSPILVVAQALGPISFSEPLTYIPLNATSYYIGLDANLTILWFVNNVPSAIDQSINVDNGSQLLYTLSNTYFQEDDRIRIIINASTGTYRNATTTIRGETEMLTFIIIVLTLAFLFLGLFIWQEEPLFGIISGIVFLLAGFIFFMTDFAGIQKMFSNGIGVICWAMCLLLLTTSYKVSKS